MNYQKLFNYFAEEHDLLLLESEMQEIIDIVDEIRPAITRQLKDFREWAESHYAGQGYHDMVWAEWEKYHSINKDYKP